ncbi:MAG: DNA polymerase III subunit gamma/tau [Gammaproteobacteria bacterium]
MAYQVLARKWRPQSFDDMVGQTHVLAALKNALDSDRLHHAYLFTGTRGVGKTTLARILARCFNCEQGVSSNPCGVCSACVSIDEGRFVDLIEVDAASRAKVEETRDLMDNVQYAPSSGRYKVYLIDEVHMFSNHSFNALLKTLEEPPPHVKFLLATTEPKKLPVTILSRCLQFNLKHLTRDQISGQLEMILEKETVTADPASPRLIAAAANGSMRDALSLLDQAIAHGGGELRETEVREMLGTIDSSDITGLLEALASGDAGSMIECIGRMDEHNPDYDSVLAELLSDLHDIAVSQVAGAAGGHIRPALLELADKLEKEEVQLYYQIALAGRRDLPNAPEPKTGFEMTMIRMIAFKPGSTGNKISSTGDRRERALPIPAKTETVATLSTDENNWEKLIEEMELNGLVKEFAGHCSLKEHSDKRLHLSLRPEQEHLLKTNQKQKLQKAIEERFGAEVKLLISVEEPVTETPIQQQHKREQARKQAAVESFQQDPHVREMIDTFDASIESDSIQPR